MSVLCVNINNTFTKHGILDGGEVLESGFLPTKLIRHPKKGIGPVLKEYAARTGEIDGLSFASVVPKATARFTAFLDLIGWEKPVHQITNENCPVPFNYPNTREIGQDILANAVAAEALYGPPVIVVDMGTAVTLDILSSKGYEGGIIAPGLDVITGYLHERTALLPKLDPNDLMVSAGIGKTTEEAMKLGCAVGFAGMIHALIDCVQKELEKRGEGEAQVIGTGGSAGILPQTWLSDIQFNPHLTLVGLEIAFKKR